MKIHVLRVGYTLEPNGASLFNAVQHDFDAALFVVAFARVVGGRSRRLCAAGIDAVSEIAIAAANFDPVS
ncbi:hypothetical protein [Paraburkholderia sp. 32]|uniref:hypothetical protein n=1 Tax=Paraburkholderia sp. 32 TaxID=2991057 RepID=UPI003D240F55